MKIYTKTGDKGETSLVSGTRVKKTHPRVEAYGTVDELNSIIGVCVSFLNQETVQDLHSLKAPLAQIQNNLFNLGSHLACEKESLREKLPQVSQEHIHDLEDLMDQMDKSLPALKNFILPGGSPLASFLHQARTVCRRAERQVLAVDDHDFLSLQYLNRLSDYLFVTARFANFKSGVSEIKWQKP